MKVKTTIAYYDVRKGNLELDKELNRIGWGNILQVTPCYCEDYDYFFMIIYKDTEVEECAENK